MPSKDPIIDCQICDKTYRKTHKSAHFKTWHKSTYIDKDKFEDASTMLSSRVKRTKSTWLLFILRMQSCRPLLKVTKINQNECGS